MNEIGFVIFITCDYFIFDTIFKNTNTSYNPDLLGRSSGKSGADIERILAFHDIGREDPVEYTTNWSEVLNNALIIKMEHDDSNEWLERQERSQ